MRLLFILLFLLNFAFNLVAQSKLIYTWEAEFTEEEKEKVQIWLGITYKAVQAKIGAYPFDV